MRNSRYVWFTAFTASFAVLAAFVFWGTWSMGFTPVMPDHPHVHSPWQTSQFLRNWLQTGNFVPSDVASLLGSGNFWQELKYALSLYAAALGLAYFCRGRGLSRLASYGAGLLLAFSGYWCTLFSAGHYGWFRWMTYGVFAFGFADRAVRGGCVRHWLLLGLSMAWASFSQPDLWFLFALFITGYLFFVAVCELKATGHAKARLLSFAKGAGASALVFFSVGAPGVYDAFFHALADRKATIKSGETVPVAATRNEAEKQWIFVTNWSLPADELREFVSARINGDTSCPFTLTLGARAGTGVRPYTGAIGRPYKAPQGNYRQHSVYVGWVTCLLALAGLVSAFLGGGRVHRREIVFFAIAAVLFCLCSLGRYCEPVYRIVYRIPFGDLVRGPVKWHHLTEFAIAVLAAFGIDAFVRLAQARVGRVRHVLLGVLGFVVAFGAWDLARVDHLYCAPIDIREALRQNCDLQMTFLQRSDFNNPHVAALVRDKKIVALGNPNPTTYLVGILRPWGAPEALPKPGIGVALGLLSLVSAAGVLAFVWFDRRKSKRM